MGGRASSSALSHTLLCARNKREECINECLSGVKKKVEEEEDEEEEEEEEEEEVSPVVSRQRRPLWDAFFAVVTGN